VLVDTHIWGGGDAAVVGGLGVEGSLALAVPTCIRVLPDSTICIVVVPYNSTTYEHVSYMTIFVL
jgi:hypothetical protein